MATISGRAAHSRCALRRHARGVSLIEALVALLMLMVGTLGLAGMQTALLAHAIASQQRLAAQALSDEILNLALVDARNVGCYRWPGAGPCESAAAAAAVRDWHERLGATLVLAEEPQLVLTDAGELSLRLRWRNKDATRIHQLETRTHVLH